MSERIIPAIIIALGLAVGGFFSGGRYELVHTEGNETGRLDRFTGEVSMCLVGAYDEPCGFVLEGSRDSD